MAARKRRAPGSAGELTRAGAVIEFIEKFLLVPEGARVGEPIRLLDFQKDIIRGIYDGDTRRAIVSFGRKNGKTSLTAMLLLAHLVGPVWRRNAQIFSAAQSRDQAAIVFNLAAKMVRMSTELNEMVVVRDSAKVLFCPNRTVPASGTVYCHKVLGRGTAETPTQPQHGGEVMDEPTLMETGPSASETWDYVRAPWGLQLELVSRVSGPSGADL